MFILPFVFLCNTVMFIILLEERFKIIVTSCIGLLAYILSLILSSAVVELFPDAAMSETIANGFNIFLLLLASIFYASNSILQKLLLALIMYFNFNFVALLTPEMLNFTPFAVEGFFPLIFVNLIYLLSCVITAAIFGGPLHYFHRNSSRLSTVTLCAFQLLACYVSTGVLEEMLNIHSYAITFFASLFLYIVVVFSYRAIYNASKQKLEDITIATDDHIANIWADNFNTMLVNIGMHKAMRKKMDYHMDKITSLAKQNRINEILDTAYDYKHSHATNALLDNYASNPHVSALLATKTAEAINQDIVLNSNVSFNDNPIDLVNLCAIIDHVISIGLEETSKVIAEQKDMSISVQSTGNSLSIEAVYMANKSEKRKSLLKISTFDDIMKLVFSDSKSNQNAQMNSLVYLVEKFKGTLSQTQTSRESTIKIILGR